MNALGAKPPTAGERALHTVKTGAVAVGSIYWNDFVDGLGDLAKIAKLVPRPSDSRDELERKLPELAKTVVKASALRVASSFVPGGPLVKAALFPLVRHAVKVASTKL